MMGSMGGSDDFDEFDVTEDEFDRMLDASEPVHVETVPRYNAQKVRAEGYYTLTRGSPQPAVAAGVGGWALRTEGHLASAVPSPG